VTQSGDGSRFPAGASEEVEDAVVSLDLVDQLCASGTLDGYHLLYGVCGDLLEKLGRSAEAAGEFRRAASLTQNESEHQLLLERAEALEDGPDSRPKRIQGAESST
jgi:predicted RNA polymerase sigma factor